LYLAARTDGTEGKVEAAVVARLEHGGAAHVAGERGLAHVARLV
jgi:hypothetical protein